MQFLESEIDQVIISISKEYKTLQKYNEKHELLKYISEVSDKGFQFLNDNDDLLNEFFEKYDPDEDNSSMLTLLKNYYSALKGANDGIEKANASKKDLENKVMNNK